jgi:hypothetical protein
MSLSKLTLLALSMVVLGMIAPANAQGQQTDKPFDFKPLLPPVAPLPPNSAVTSGSVGGSQNPYTTAPLQSPTQPSTSQSAPGMRFSIPSR